MSATEEPAATTATERFCVSCRHLESEFVRLLIRGSAADVESHCAHPEAERSDSWLKHLARNNGQIPPRRVQRDPVSGSPILDRHSCVNEREVGGGCGPDGERWEPCE